jgi:hypothetical protein
MDKLIAPKGIKTGTFRCLKSGVNPGFPEQGTPQGGVISPLFANIAGRLFGRKSTVVHKPP